MRQERGRDERGGGMGGDEKSREEGVVRKVREVRGKGEGIRN